MEPPISPPDPIDNPAYRTVDVTVRLKVWSTSEMAEHHAMVAVEKVITAEGWQVTDATLIEQP